MDAKDIGPPWCFGCNGPPCAACGCALCLVARQAVAAEREAILRIVQKADDDSATYGWIADQIRARGSS